MSKKTQEASEKEKQKAKVEAMKQAAKSDPDLAGFPVRKRFVLFCLKLAKGIVTVACHNAGISRRAYYDWMMEGSKAYDKEFAAKAKDIREQTHDWVESKLLQNIENNDQKAIEYYLSNNAKERGYSTQTISQKTDVTTKGESLNKSFYELLKEVAVVDDGDRSTGEE